MLIESGLVNQNTISRYKDILAKKGVVDTSVRGKVALSLPRFGEFAIDKMEGF